MCKTKSYLLQPHVFHHLVKLYHWGSNMIKEPRNNNPSQNSQRKKEGEEESRQFSRTEDIGEKNRVGKRFDCRGIGLIKNCVAREFFSLVLLNVLPLDEFKIMYIILDFEQFPEGTHPSTENRIVYKQRKT
jgi:hypothetical protein